MLSSMFGCISFCIIVFVTNNYLFKHSMVTRWRNLLLILYQRIDRCIQQRQEFNHGKRSI